MANYVQENFGFYNDDGGEAAATTYAAQNTNVSPTLSANLNLVLRVGVASTTAGGIVASSWGIQLSKNGGAYAAVTTGTSNVKAFDSTNLTDDGATTNRLSGGTGVFLAGGIAEDGLYDSGGALFSLPNGRFTEFLYPITLINADLANGDTLDFRVYRSGGVLNTYTFTPRVTVVKGSTAPPNTGFPVPPAPLPPVPAPVIPPNSSKIQVIDHTGRLSKNPAKWPAGLKEAIAGCCGCDESSTVADPCTACGSRSLSENLQGNIKKTKTHDTGLTLRYWPSVLIKFNAPGNSEQETWPDWLPKEVLPGLGYVLGFGGGQSIFRAGGAWYSDLYEDYEQDYDLNGYFYVSLGGINQVKINYHIVMNLKVYYYVTYGFYYTNANPPTPCDLRVRQCSYPTGTIYYKAAIGGLPPGVPATQKIDYHLNTGFPGIINPWVINLNAKNESSEVITTGSIGTFPPIGNPKKGIGDCAGQPGQYYGLECDPWLRRYVFKMPGNPATATTLSSGLIARPLTLVAINLPPRSPGQIGTALANPLSFDDIENGVSSCTTPVNINQSPLVEVFD